MPIQTNRLEKSKFRSAQATNFSGLLRIAVHQTFKCTVPTQNVPESCKFRVRKWFCENIGYLEIGTNTGQFDVSTKALRPAMCSWLHTKNDMQVRRRQATAEWPP